MSVLIIDGLEIIDVHANYRKRLIAHALALRDPLLKHHVEPTRIG